MSKTNILIVEDDTDLLDIMSQFLTGKGYRVRKAETLAEGFAQFESEAIDLVLLDIILPDGLGLELLRKIREDSIIPVILLTSLGKDADVVRGLDMGADDYIAKPCSLEVVFARVKTHLGKAMYDMRGTVTAGALRLDKSTGRAYLDGTDMKLTPKQFALLLYLAQHAGQTVPGDRLYSAIWGDDPNGDTGALRRQISNLRGKLEACENCGIDLVFVYGDGYMLELE